jgi:hypothetical protein
MEHIGLWRYHLKNDCPAKSGFNPNRVHNPSMLFLLLAAAAAGDMPVPCGPMAAHNGTVHEAEYEYAETYATVTAYVLEANANASLDYAIALHNFFSDHDKWWPQARNVVERTHGLNPTTREANSMAVRYGFSSTFDRIGPEPTRPTRQRVTLAEVISSHPDKPWARSMALHKERVDAWMATHFSAAQVYTVFNPSVKAGDAYFKNFSENVVLALLHKEYRMSYVGPLWCDGRPVIPAWETLYKAHNETMAAFGPTDDYEPHIERMENSAAVDKKVKLYTGG